MDKVVRRDTALGHLLVVPLGNDSLRVWISMNNWDWRLSSDKGQQRSYDQSLSHGGIMTLVYHYGSARDECGRALVWG
jgi:hypothetical protein